MSSRGGLSTGEQILAVGDMNVAAPGDVTTAVAAAKQDGAKDVLLRVRSGQAVRYVAVPLA